MNRYILKLGHKLKSTWGGTTIEAQGILSCYGEHPQQLIIYGLHPNSPVPPSPVCNWSVRLGAIFVPFADFPAYVDIVRNEKPVYARVTSDDPDAMDLGTDMEQIGEGE
nr:MAG: hypothetical protein E4H34_00725 [Hyphomicrobiales bacterium]